MNLLLLASEGGDRWTANEIAKGLGIVIAVMVGWMLVWAYVKGNKKK